MSKDCASCMNCDFVRGFMCTCHYSYDTETSVANFMEAVGIDDDVVAFEVKAEQYEY